MGSQMRGWGWGLGRADLRGCGISFAGLAQNLAMVPEEGWRWRSSKCSWCSSSSGKALHVTVDNVVSGL